MPDLVVGLIGDLTPFPPTETQILGLGIYYASIAFVLIIGSIGLFFKSNFCRILAMIGSGYFLIFGFPIAITFFLAENEVKSLFKKERSE
jgi:hypothetical protein